MANEDFYSLSSSQNSYTQFHGVSSGEAQGAYYIGQSVSVPGNYYDGAARFTGIGIGQGVSVNYAQLRLYSQYQGTADSIKMKTYGIKEVNTSTFSSNPFGRTKTTAVTTQTSGRPGVGAFIGVDVTSQVNEILGQGGWTSGNAMGFFSFDNSSDSGAFIGDESLKTQLLIRVSAQPNFTPTPGTVSAPSFPASTDYGIRISQSGIDVKTANESQLYFTTRKKEMRVNEERIIGTATIFSHGLSYAPCTLGYNIDSSGHIVIMNFPSNVISTEPYVGADSTNVVLFPDQGAYIYVFIDPLI
jgi:hypothetical protein